MKLALISDIHANLPALEAVLAHARAQGVKKIWCLGDLVQFNAFPDEVVKTIRNVSSKAIHGNIDLMVLSMKRDLKKTPYKELPEEETPFAWSYLQLSKKNRKYLKKLPEKLEVTLKGYRFLLVHGSPMANDDPIYIDTPDERLVELAANTSADCILCGHTHKPFIREVNGVQFINPGSVGRPIDHDPRASYAIINVKNSSITVEFFRVEYNIDIAVTAILESELPKIYAQLVEAGITKDDIKPPDMDNKEAGL